MEFKEIIIEILNIRKQRKILYGDSWRELGINGNFYMIFMKFIRLKYLLEKNKSKLNSMKDTLIDLINYSLFMLVLLEEENDKNKKRKIRKN